MKITINGTTTTLGALNDDQILRIMQTINRLPEDHDADFAYLVGVDRLGRDPEDEREIVGCTVAGFTPETLAFVDGPLGYELVS